MLPVAHLKKTLDFNKSFRSLLEVLKLVAVAEYYNLERKLKSFDRFREVLGSFLDSVDLDLIQHPFITQSSKPPGILAMTSDAGLLGGINVQVVSKAMDLVSETGGKLVVLGERGFIYAQGSGIPFEYFPGVVDSNRFNQACEIRNYMTQKIMSGELGGFKVVFPRALSFAVHHVEVETLLPFVKTSTSGREIPKEKKEIIFDSSPEEVSEYLAYLLVGQRLFEIFGMSRVCEQAARFLHLDESCNKIQEMNKKLTLQYFRRRHEIIDANMRELFSARSIYEK